MATKDITSWLSGRVENSPDTGPSASMPPGSATRSSARTRADENLGAPLTIEQAAALIGCSPWTVRHTLIPQGLPCFRIRANGKLIFYEQQVVRFVLRTQRVQGGQP
jgi:hypothetical protein